MVRKLLIIRDYLSNFNQCLSLHILWNIIQSETYFLDSIFQSTPDQTKKQFCL